MLEKMDVFFTARVDGYDEHMKTNIEGASSFYKYTASLLPAEKDAAVLDLGCGTGLELEEYFDVPFGEEKFDAAVSVESLHHFFKEQKIPLYSKLREALKLGSYFILTDYFADLDEQEDFFRRELIRIRKEQDLHWLRRFAVGK